MFELEALLILNQFQIGARLLELAEEKKPGEQDRAGSDEKEKDRRRYLNDGIKRIEQFERRSRGDAQ